MINTNKSIRLKKDGTPDKRGGKVGNRGNRHATGRKKIAGQETRKHISFKATKNEYRLLLQYARILKKDFTLGIEILKKAGFVPVGRAKKDSSRKGYVIRVLEREKAPIKNMLAIIKDRYELTHILLSNYNNIIAGRPAGRAGQPDGQQVEQVSQMASR